MAAADDVTSPVFDSSADGANGGGEAEAAALAAKARRRRRLKAALLLLIAAIIALLLWLLLSGEESLPGISEKLPHYEKSFYGATQPMDVAVSADGERIYVTETGGKRLVRVYDPSGGQVDALMPPGKQAKLRLPVYAAVDPRSGDLYVSERLDESVRVYDEEGKQRRVFQPGGPLGRGANPLGLAFGPQGDLYMTDVGGGRRSHRVLELDPHREERLRDEPLREIGRPGSLWFPNGLAIDSGGEIYVTDSNNGRLAIFAPDGELLASIQRGVAEGDLGLPRGVAIHDGRLYVVDATSHAVKVYELGGDSPVPDFVGSFGVEGIADGTFRYPNGIAIDAEGRIYVTDRENDRVQVWTY